MQIWPKLNKEIAIKLLKQNESPLFVYDEQTIIDRCRQVIKAAEGFQVLYAMKANSNHQILKLLKNQGIERVDVVSPGEIEHALWCGFDPKKILYTENYGSGSEIAYAIQKGVILNFGAIDTISANAQKLKGRQIFIRINPYLGAGENAHVVTGGRESKFGICYADLYQATKICNQNEIRIVGLHQHIGSNLKAPDQEIVLKAVKYLLDLTHKFQLPQLQYLDVGGGLGVKYRQQDKLMDLRAFYKEVKFMQQQQNIKRKEQNKRELQIWVEPGRYFVAEAGILLCQLTAKKQNPGTLESGHVVLKEVGSEKLVSEKKIPPKIFVGINTGFNHLIRPAFYGSHHEIVNLSRPDAPKETVTVCGNLCECSDKFAQDIEFGGQIGDILSIQNAGAYCFSMSSNYNLRPRPAQVLICSNGSHLVIRRKQTYEDLIMTQVMY